MPTRMDFCDACGADDPRYRLGKDTSGNVYCEGCARRRGDQDIAAAEGALAACLAAADIAMRLGVTYGELQRAISGLRKPDASLRPGARGSGMSVTADRPSLHLAAVGGRPASSTPRPVKLLTDSEGLELAIEGLRGVVARLPRGSDLRRTLAHALVELEYEGDEAAE